MDTPELTSHSTSNHIHSVASVTSSSHAGSSSILAPLLSQPRSQGKNVELTGMVLLVNGGKSQPHLQDDAVRLVEVRCTPAGTRAFLCCWPQTQKLPATGQDPKKEGGLEEPLKWLSRE
ncbi:hypothetical protein P7K49_035771, partial [Saguinus oedipus]